MMDDGPLLSFATAAECFDVQFHPSESLVAAATVTGEVELHRFKVDEKTVEHLRTFQSHKESCRQARFLYAADARNTARLASASASRWTALSDVETGGKIWKAKLRGAGNALFPFPDGHRLAVGDDDGGVSIFDVREKKPVGEFAENEDFISDLGLGTDEYSLCATSGDGTLAVYDVRKTGTKGLIAMSDFLEDEFQCLTIVRQGSKVVCGSQTGVLAVFSWGDFGDMKDRIRGHPESVDAMVKLTEDCILTGSSDGYIRVVSVYKAQMPNQVLGLLGQHGEFPVESLALSPDGGLLISASPHGQPAVRLWSTEVAHKLLSKEAESADATATADTAEKDSDDSSEEQPAKKKLRKKKKGRKNAIAMQGDARKTGAKSFFSGL
eukprot:TRINITY_DN78172_c0_g1_i1.p1 TRINITY_DN78172_c0_g1~~TRINITY_DN78172_c0_g1_i1.p1  ORF type:complete len:382 (-),score=72.79 TRINITY_DN78172_c0_g1_i1:71-1216(-)